MGRVSSAVRVEVDWGGDGTYGHADSDVSKRVRSLSWLVGARLTGNPDRPSIRTLLGSLTLDDAVALSRGSRLQRPLMRVSLGGSKVLQGRIGDPDLLDIRSARWRISSDLPALLTEPLAWQQLDPEFATTSTIRTRLSSDLGAELILAPSHVPTALSVILFEGRKGGIVGEYAKVASALPAETEAGAISLLDLTPPMPPAAPLHLSSSSYRVYPSARPSRTSSDLLINAACAELIGYNRADVVVPKEAAFYAPSPQSSITSANNRGAQTVTVTVTIPAPPTADGHLRDFAVAVSETRSARIRAKTQWVVFLQGGQRAQYLHNYTGIDGVRGNPDIMDGVSLGPLTKVVHADRSVTLSVDVTAPNLPGAWTWQMEYLPSGQFGAARYQTYTRSRWTPFQHDGDHTQPGATDRGSGLLPGPAAIPIDFSYGLLTAPTGDSAVDDVTRETVVPVKVSHAQSRLRWGTRESVYPSGWLNPTGAQASLARLINATAAPKHSHSLTVPLAQDDAARAAAVAGLGVGDVVSLKLDDAARGLAISEYCVVAQLGLDWQADGPPVRRVVLLELGHPYGSSAVAPPTPTPTPTPTPPTPPPLPPLSIAAFDTTGLNAPVVLALLTATVSGIDITVDAVVPDEGELDVASNLTIDHLERRASGAQLRLRKRGSGSFRTFFRVGGTPVYPAATLYIQVIKDNAYVVVPMVQTGSGGAYSNWDVKVAAQAAVIAGLETGDKFLLAIAEPARP